MSMPSEPTSQVPESNEPQGVSRRGFLGGAGVAAAGLAAGSVSFESLVNARPAAAIVSPNVALNARKNASYLCRKYAADYWRAQGIVQHPTNGDEARYPDKIANHSKSLPHNQFGEVDLAAYNSLLAAIASGNPADYDSIIINPGAVKLTNPQCGLAFDMEGIDAQAVAVPPPPTLASREQAGEMVENYSMALLRDVNFEDYASSPAAAQAIADLNAFGADFKGPKQAGLVTPQTLFRDIAVGTTTGPYISQFMYLPTPFGSQYVENKVWTLSAGSDHLQSWTDYLAARNGQVPGSESFAGARRYIVNGRDLSAFVHIDVLFQAYFNACLILITPPDNSDVGGGIGCPPSASNPYVGNATQSGFCSFGAPAAKVLMCEVAGRCLKATWHKKWQVHRRLRPEEMAGLVEVQNHQSPGRYNGILHPSVMNSPVIGRIESRNGGSHLLPMAFPEGCPTHPSYTAGHATVAGACITVLKALLDTENRPIANPVVPTADGSALVPYTGPTLTIEGELNKLASNIATGRNVAGVHWRSDAYASMRIGQTVAISILRDYKSQHNEANVAFNFRGFDGERIII